MTTCSRRTGFFASALPVLNGARPKSKPVVDEVVVFAGIPEIVGTVENAMDRPSKLFTIFDRNMLLAESFARTDGLHSHNLQIKKKVLVSVGTNPP